MTGGKKHWNERAFDIFFINYYDAYIYTQWKYMQKEYKQDATI